MEGITPGRIVHFFDSKIADGPRAAMIVRAWGDGGTVNLTVFSDWQNDTATLGGEPTVWKTSIQHKSQAPEGASYWDWPERRA